MGRISIVVAFFIGIGMLQVSASYNINEYALMVEPDSSPGTPTFSGRSLWIIENILAPGPIHEQRLDSHLTTSTQTEPLLGGAPLPNRRTFQFPETDVSCSSNIQALVDFIKRKIWPSDPRGS